MNCDIKIISTGTALPHYHYTNSEVTEKAMEWVKDQPEKLQKLTKKIFESSNIKERHFISPLDTVLNPTSLTDSNERYVDAAKVLSQKALEQALIKANIDAVDIDCLITTSCTGYMIPSIDVYLINHLHMRRDIRRMPITEIGCGAGASGLIYGSDFLKGHANARVAIVSLEFPTNTIQLDDFSVENIVGNAVFADGVSCKILSNRPEDQGLPMVDTFMHQIPGTTELLGYCLTETGFKLTLDRRIPDVIAGNFLPVVTPFLEKNAISFENIDDVIAHPGGIKVIDQLEDLLAEYNKNVADSRYIMQQYGNMSSATIGFILDRYLTNNKGKEKSLIVLSFGPGFMIHGLLFKGLVS